MPLAIRWLLLLVAGATLAQLANWVAWWLVRAHPPVATAASTPRHRQKKATVNQRSLAWLPIMGAWRARRSDDPCSGPSGWRPLFVEVILAIVIPALYWWEIDQAALLQTLAPAGFIPDAADLAVLRAGFLSHVVLIAFMLAASLVDVDEQTIPDLITIPGTLLWLAIAAVWPHTLLPVVVAGKQAPKVSFLNLASPNDAQAILAPAAQSTWLVVGLTCFALWCLALLPWRGKTNRGWAFALRMLWAGWKRDPMSIVVLLCAVAGVCGIGCTWWLGGDRWLGLLSALVGMAMGGALIWAVRVAAGWALGREAMGFGDVTLMAMIGSFLGWQTGPIVFFLAPLAGLVVGLIQWFAYRDNVIPYGPFLCLAALVVVLKWGPVWHWAMPLYDLPWLVPTALAVCLVMLAMLLRVWRTIRGGFDSGE
ncbi:MAG TPA: A24 family peptidase [Pirellulales bacterium]|jgi:prepilin signal peptidase PulO-like enzyme (type II secretory pathway)